MRKNGTSTHSVLCTTSTENGVINTKNAEKAKAWTIINALSFLYETAKRMSFTDKLWLTALPATDFLTKELGLTKFQCLIIAILIEADEAQSWGEIAVELGCSRLTLMEFSDEIDDLIDKQWIRRMVYNDHRGSHEAFDVCEDVVTSLRRNKAFVPEKLEGLDIQQFVDKMERRVFKCITNRLEPFKAANDWMMKICRANPQLELCDAVLQFDDPDSQTLILLNVYDYARYAGSENEGITTHDVKRALLDNFDCDLVIHALQEGRHPLIQEGYFEHRCEDGIADNSRFILTRKFKEDLLAGYKPSRAECYDIKRANRDVKCHSLIKQKTMYYNANEQAEIDRLTSLLSQDNLRGIQERLEKEGMRKGFACLFHGCPGTGKTETVLQIARQTGRDIMQIDIAGMRDKYVGESEKNIKQVFARYKTLCRQNEVMPILFFNEADGIFGKRTSFNGNNPSVEKMDNAMQNIILQEMEDLEGILIATTNLTCNLDDAFERRFLFKVEFNKPDTEVKAKLWSSMLGDSISDDDAHRLAKDYDFSGGQIENIARKRTIEYILSGKKGGYKEIDEYCRHESLTKKQQHNPIGFH